MVRLAALLPVLLGLATAAFPAQAQSDAAATITFQGVARDYVLHLPPGVQTGLPLVVTLHGLTQSVEDLRAELRLDPVADREGFAVVYPEAIGGRWSYWDGDGVNMPGTGIEIDDTGFLHALIDALIFRHLADPARILVTGVSNGGLMAWTLACRVPDRIAGVAPMLTAMTDGQIEQCHSSHQIPIMAVAGTGDPVQAYDGWLGPRFRLLSLPETMEFWRLRHGCTGETSSFRPHRPGTNATRVLQIDWTGCSVGGPLRQFRVEAGGHQVPSLAPTAEGQSRSFGLRNQDIETAEEFWAFFKPQLSR